jgi:hypothetical protein
MEAIKIAESSSSHHQHEPAKKVKARSSWNVLNAVSSVGTKISSVRYLFADPGAAAATLRESQDFIAIGMRLSNFGIEQYAGGKLPANLPFLAFADYASIQPPTMVPQAALSYGLADQMANIPSTDGAKMTFYKIIPDIHDEGKLIIIPDQMTSQTLRDFANNPNLVNLCVRVSKYGKTTIRCGVFNDSAKAAQFVAVLKKVLQKDDGPLKRVRVVAHNLCSYGIAKESNKKRKSETKVKKLVGEADLIVGQHEQIRLMESDLDSLTVKKVSPQVGIHFTSFEPTGKILGDSTDSHARNVDATATYLRWLQKSFFSNNPPAFLTTDEGQPLHIAKQLARARTKLIRAEEKLFACQSKDHISELKAEVDRHATAIGTKTEELKEALSSLTDKLQQLSEDVSGKKKPERAIATKLVAHYLTIQMSQCDEKSWPPLTRAQELALSFLVDYALPDVITELNCKSGVDRTGLAAAIFYALEQMIERDLDAGKTKAAALEHSYDFLLNFLNNVHLMDDAIGNKDTLDLDAWLASEVGQPFAETVHFQRDIFAYVMGISEPLEFHSSGFRGLKWKLNRMMFDWLPSFVHDTATGNWIKVTTPSTSTPNQRKLTKEGKALFIGPAYQRNG